MKVDELLERQQPRRKVQGMAAALFPYEPDGRVAVEAFAKQLTSTHEAGLMNAVNMDTGYVNYLSDTEKQEVLDWTRQALGKGIPFVAGAYIENQTGDDVAIVNAAENLPETKARKITFSAYSDRADFRLAAGAIVHDNQPVLRLAETKLRGSHNIENLMATLAAGKARGLSFEQMVPPLAAYEPRPQRCEFIRQMISPRHHDAGRLQPMQRRCSQHAIHV